MAFYLGDDGTMDTVVVCEECGEEMRYSYDPVEPEPDDERTDQEAYDDFVEWCLEDAASEHECRQDEPQEGDIITGDHELFYQNGHLVLSHASNGEWYVHSKAYPAGDSLGTFDDDYKAALRAYMELTWYWPNVWFISDHGNAHLIEL